MADKADTHSAVYSDQGGLSREHPVPLGLAVLPLGVLAAAGLLLLMVGALGAHLYHHDGVAEMAPALVVIVLLGACMWLACGKI